MLTLVGSISTISKKLPELITNAVHETFFNLIASMPKLVGSDGKLYQSPSDFDWDIHPGGIGVYSRIMEVMGLTKSHTTATVTAYENWGNSAGPTVLKVLDIRRTLPVKREYIVCCGFGNNIDVTMLILRRR
jgi:type III polyketide synthase